MGRGPAKARSTAQKMDIQESKKNAICTVITLREGLGAVCGHPLISRRMSREELSEHATIVSPSLRRRCKA